MEQPNCHEILHVNSLLFNTKRLQEVRLGSDQIDASSGGWITQLLLIIILISDSVADVIISRGKNCWRI